ncbi:MAG: hypothetical protein ABI651_04800 [Verrucomicrobiota bacterium]
MSNLLATIPFPIWGAVSLVVAAVYSFWAPGLSAKAVVASLSLWQYFILRWFHPLVWVVLAASFFFRGSSLAHRRYVANVLALIALALYVMFLLTFAIFRMRQK